MSIIDKCSVYSYILYGGDSLKYSNFMCDRADNVSNCWHCDFSSQPQGSCFLLVGVGVGVIFTGAPGCGMCDDDLLSWGHHITKLLTCWAHSFSFPLSFS